MLKLNQQPKFKKVPNFYVVWMDDLLLEGWNFPISFSVWPTIVFWLVNLLDNFYPCWLKDNQRNVLDQVSKTVFFFIYLRRVYKILEKSFWQ